ncbi:hypothetical protein JCM6882_004996 [Rhodosporidiobolus microsporus]
MATIHDLPDKVLGIILRELEALDWLHGHRSRELRDASKVCRRFRAAAQPHMWRYLELKDPWVAEPLLRVLEASPELGQHTRLVAVEGDWLSEGCLPDSRAFAAILQRMPLLEELRIYGLVETMVQACSKLPSTSNQRLARLAISSRTNQEDLTSFFASPVFEDVRALAFFPTTDVERRQEELAPRWRELEDSCDGTIPPDRLEGFLVSCGQPTVPDKMMARLEMLQISVRSPLTPFLPATLTDTHSASHHGVPLLYSIPQTLPLEHFIPLLVDPFLQHLSLSPYVFWPPEWDHQTLPSYIAAFAWSTLHTLYLPRPDFRIAAPSTKLKQQQKQLLAVCEAQGIEVIQGRRMEWTGVDARFFQWAKRERQSKEA